MSTLYAYIICEFSTEVVPSFEFQYRGCTKLFVVSLNSVGLLYTMSYVYKYYSMNNVWPL